MDGWIERWIDGWVSQSTCLQGAQSSKDLNSYSQNMGDKI